MLIVTADESKGSAPQNDISSSKDAHKQTNETTSRDEPTGKSSTLIKVPKPVQKAA